MRTLSTRVFPCFLLPFLYFIYTYTHTATYRTHTHKNWCNARWENNKMYSGKKKCYATPSSSENICASVNVTQNNAWICIIIVFPFFVSYICYGMPYQGAATSFVIFLLLYSFIIIIWRTFFGYFIKKKLRRYIILRLPHIYSLRHTLLY